MSESSITFFISCNCVTCNCNICDHLMTDVTLLSQFVTCVTITCNFTSYFLLKSKIKKTETENQK